MSNNITFSTEDIGSGVQLKRTKIVLGDSPTDSGDVSSLNPLPVTGTVTANAGTGTFTTSPTGTQTIAGTVTAVQSGTYTTSPTGTQAVTGTVVANAGTGTFTVDGSGVTQPISGTVSVGNSPTVTVSNFPSIQTIAGIVNQGTQGSIAESWLVEVTDGTNILGTSTHPVVVSGTVTANPSGTQSISGTVTANAGTGTFTVDGSGVTQPISVVSLPLPSGAATSVKQPALGTAGTASADVITVQGISGMTALKVDNSGVTQPISGTITANAGSGTFTVDGSGHTQPVSGTVIANAGSGTFVVSVSNSPTVTANAGTGVFKVDGSAVTQPISVASLPLPSGAATSTKQPALGTAGIASADVVTIQGVSGMTAVKIDGSAVTQPVSGTITSVPSGTQTVAGTVTANAGSGTFTVGQGTASNLKAQVTGAGSAGSADTGVVSIQGISGMTAVKVDGSGVTQPVSLSGNVMVVQSTASNLLANVGGLAAAGSAPAGNPVSIAGYDGTNVRRISTDTNGYMYMLSPKITIANVTSAVYTTNGNSPSFSVQGLKYLRVGVNVTAVSGVSPILQLTMQDQGPDGNWYSVPFDAGFASFTTVSTRATNITPGPVFSTNFGPLYECIFTSTIRLNWSISGTSPSFTFNYWIVGQA